MKFDEVLDIHSSNPGINLDNKEPQINEDLDINDSNTKGVNFCINNQKISGEMDIHMSKVEINKPKVDKGFYINKKLSKKINFSLNLNLSKFNEWTQILEIIKEIDNHVENETYEIDNLSQSIIKLFDICPIINFTNITPIFEFKDFDIFDEKKPNKFLFEINLYNLISIINLYWTITKDSKNFNNYLHKLGINFSFVKRDIKTNEIDFILLSSVSTQLYN